MIKIKNVIWIIIIDNFKETTINKNSNNFNLQKKLVTATIKTLSFIDLVLALNYKIVLKERKKKLMFNYWLLNCLKTEKLSNL